MVASTAFLVLAGSALSDRPPSDAWCYLCFKANEGTQKILPPALVSLERLSLNLIASLEILEGDYPTSAFPPLR